MTFRETHLKIQTMQVLNLNSSDPGSYVLAADARFGPTDYSNDHIWELHLEGGEPPAVALRTSFGLRARSFRLFPRFSEGDIAVTDPSQFYKPPAVQKVFPNYLMLSCSPLEGIDVKQEYWVPESQIVCGRVNITNSRLSPRKIQFEWIAVLMPSEGGQRMAPINMEAATVLCGKTDEIFPVLFMTGGPDIGSGLYPALSVELEMGAGSSRQFTWAQSALLSQEASFELARKTAARPWDAETARLEVINSGLIEVETGDPKWNAAFYLTQKAALGLLVGPTNQLPHPSFVSSRQPDQGFSLRGDGSDYGILWNGQTPLEADYLTTLLIPASTDLAKGILFNFLENQTQQGFIDLKPGLAGQRANLLATPILTNLAWRIYQTTEELSFLAEVFPKLVSFIQAWFTNSQDRDGDGLPEWARVTQSGFDDHPTFAQWQTWAQGADITKVESPSLCAFLYRGIQILLRMAKLLNETGPVSALEAWADNLKCAIDAAWDESEKVYRNWDRETHFSPKGESLGELLGNGEVHIDREFNYPIRLLFKIQATTEVPHSIRIFIHGTGVGGNHRVERINEDQFRWNLNLGNVCSERTYKTIESIQVQGILDQDRISLQVMDLSHLDQTLLLPLWAEVVDKDYVHKFVKETIQNSALFWHLYGISACPIDPDHPDHPCVNVHMPWNQLIGEGLLAYGFREEAIELINHLMTATIQNLEKNKAFYRNYHATNGQGIGDRHALSGLAPLGLFLEALGVRIISNKKVYLKGLNQFPWPVTIKYQGMKITCESKKTTITFPGGQTTIVRNPNPRLITLDD